MWSRYAQFWAHQKAASPEAAFVLCEFSKLIETHDENQGGRCGTMALGGVYRMADTIEVPRELAATALNEALAFSAEAVTIHDLRPDGVEPHIPHLYSLAAVQALFGLEIDRSLGWDITPPGKACWKLTAIQLRTGIAAIIPLVIGPTGLPNANILVYQNWPGAPAQTVTPTPPYFPNYVAGWTDSNGVIGFGYGGSGVVGTGGGPFSVWPSNAPTVPVVLEPQYADCLKRIGWLGGTDHFTPSPVFEYTVKPTIEPDPVDPEPSGCLLAILNALVAALKSR